MKKTFCICVMISILLVGCTSSLGEKKNLKITHEFYDTYAERKDLNKLMEFYSATPKYIDVVPQMVVEGKDNLKNQYNWSDANYKIHPDYLKSVRIDEILSNDSVVVVSGQYNPYYYNGNLIKEMRFTSWLYFNKEGKIEKQVEWTQYPINILEEIINIKKSMEIN